MKTTKHLHGLRIAGTVVLLIPALITYVYGLTTIWNEWLQTLPLLLAVPALLGCIVAPLQIVRDVLAEQRLAEVQANDTSATGE